jgi:pimeloyl-ACP methyl ester carboxylesterase
VVPPGDTAATAPPTLVALPGGRTLALDDVGDPSGTPVLYLHGTPDARLARHPDDGLATAAGVRLLAVDRPGYGASDPLPADTGTGSGAGPHAYAYAYADDVTSMLDALGLDRVAVLAWSGGALAALTVAAAPSLARRVRALGIAAGVVPREAYADPAVRAAAPERADLHDLAHELAPGELGPMIAPMLAPYPCDRELAAEHQAESRNPGDTAEVASVPGAADRLAAALAEGVRTGLAGVEADVEATNRPLGVDLAAIRAPVRLWWGDRDTVTPPAFGTWYAAHLPGATLEVVPGAGHYLPLTRWAAILGELAAAGA